MYNETLPDIGCGFMAFILGLYVMDQSKYLTDLSPEGNLIIVLISAFMLIWGVHKGLIGINDIVDCIAVWIKEKRMKEVKEITGMKES